MRFLVLHRAVFVALTGLALVGPPVQAQGLLGRLTGANQVERVELKEGVDLPEAFTKAFSAGGAFAQSLRRPDFAQRKLAIGVFELEFATEQLGTAKGGAGARDHQLSYFLRNTTEAQMQNITNQAYQAFASSLKARGYELVPVEAMQATAFKEQLALGGKGPVKQERGALSKMLGSKDTEVDNASVVVNAADTAPHPGMQLMSAGPLGQLAQDLGAVAVAVRLKVNFARFDDVGRFLAAELEDKPQNVIAVKGSRLEIYAPDRNLWLMPLSKGIGLPSAVADTATRMAVSTEEKTAAAASVGVSVVLGFFGGSGRGGLSGAVGSINSQDAAALMGESAKFEVSAGADYEQRMGKDLQLVMQLLAEAFPK